MVKYSKVRTRRPTPNSPRHIPPLAWCPERRLVVSALHYRTVRLICVPDSLYGAPVTLVSPQLHAEFRLSLASGRFTTHQTQLLMACTHRHMVTREENKNFIRRQRLTAQYQCVRCVPSRKNCSALSSSASARCLVRGTIFPCFIFIQEISPLMAITPNLGA
jgi:hypothetical protein